MGQLNWKAAMASLEARFPKDMARDEKQLLADLPWPLNQQLLEGDFEQASDIWRIIPTHWVELAQQRWSFGPPESLCSIGVNVARGGSELTVAIAERYGAWLNFVSLVSEPYNDSGVTDVSVAEIIEMNYQPGIDIHLNLHNVGIETLDILKQKEIPTWAYDYAAQSDVYDASGKFRYANRRAEIWFELRNALDPENGGDVALPDDDMLKRELCTPHFSVTAGGIQVESKIDLLNRTGDNIDRAEAVALAFYKRS